MLFVVIFMGLFPLGFQLYVWGIFIFILSRKSHICSGRLNLEGWVHYIIVSEPFGSTLDLYGLEINMNLVNSSSHHLSSVEFGEEGKI